jgi:hypothetical protein
MKTDHTLKVLLGIVAVLLFLNFMNNILSSKSASAVSVDRSIGRYQIAAWAVQAQSAEPRSGYYVLDTATGQITAGKTEIIR